MFQVLPTDTPDEVIRKTADALADFRDRAGSALDAGLTSEVQAFCRDLDQWQVLNLPPVSHITLDAAPRESGWRRGLLNRRPVKRDGEW